MEIHQANQIIEHALQLFNKGQYREASQFFFEVLAKYQSPSLLIACATTCLLLEEHDKALNLVNSAIASEPTAPAAYSLKIEILKALNKHEEILTTANELLLIDPANTAASLLRGEVYTYLKRPVFAVAAFKSHLKQRHPDRLDIDQLTDADVHYHLNHIRAQQTPNVDYPSHVAFESYALCNAKCSFCVYPDLARQGTMMPMELIDKIISDLTEIPIPFQLSPFAVNEPFMDKRIFDILEKISTRLPLAQITLTSNASPLNEANLKRLAKFKLSYLWFSVVDYRKEAYEEKMKLSYELMISRLTMIHKAKAEGWFPYRVVLSRLLDHSEHDQKYVDFMKERFPLFEVCLWPYANWIGQTTNEVTSAVSNIPCTHWFEFRIAADGQVQHCCMDGHTKYPWGDVNKQSVLEIYNQEAYRKLRTSTFSRLDVSPCNQCNLR